MIISIEDQVLEFMHDDPKCRAITSIKSIVVGKVTNVANIICTKLIKSFRITSK